MRKRRKSLPAAEQFHARKMRELGMSLKACADYFNVSVATLCRGLAEVRARMGDEKLPQERRHLAREGLRNHRSVGERTSST